jgi:hypothetical protein
LKKRSPRRATNKGWHGGFGFAKLWAFKSI